MFKFIYFQIFVIFFLFFVILIYVFINKTNGEIEVYNETNEKIEVIIYYTSGIIIDDKKEINKSSKEVFKIKLSGFIDDDKIIIEVNFHNRNKLIERFYSPSGFNFFEKNIDKYKITNDDIKPINKYAD